MKHVTVCHHLSKVLFFIPMLIPLTIFTLIYHTSKEFIPFLLEYSKVCENIFFFLVIHTNVYFSTG